MNSTNKGICTNCVCVPYSVLVGALLSNRPVKVLQIVVLLITTGCCSLVRTKSQFIDLNKKKHVFFVGIVIPFIF